MFGLVLLAMSTGLAGDRLPEPVVPRFVLALAGVLVCAAGGMAWFRDDAIRNNGFAVVFLGVSAWIGFWVAFRGDPEHMSGGLPILPHEINMSLGRLAFGVGAVISTSLAVYAAVLCRRAVKQKIADTHDTGSKSGRSSQSHMM